MNAFKRDLVLARLVTVKAVDRGRNADRPAGVRTKGHIAQADGNGDGSRGRRPAGYPLRIEDIPGGAVMRIESHSRIGKLTHAGAAKGNATGLLDPFDHRTVGSRWFAFEHKP